MTQADRPYESNFRQWSENRQGDDKLPRLGETVFKPIRIINNEDRPSQSLSFLERSDKNSLRLVSFAAALRFLTRSQDADMSKLAAFQAVLAPENRLTYSYDSERDPFSVKKLEEIGADPISATETVHRIRSGKLATLTRSVINISDGSMYFGHRIKAFQAGIFPNHNGETRLVATRVVGLAVDKVGTPDATRQPFEAWIEPLVVDRRSREIGLPPKGFEPFPHLYVAMRGR